MFTKKIFRGKVVHFELENSYSFDSVSVFLPHDSPCGEDINDLAKQRYPRTFGFLSAYGRCIAEHSRK